MKNLYHLTNEVQAMHDNFCYQVMKSYFELMVKMFSETHNGYKLVFSDLRDDSMAHKKNELKLNLNFNNANEQQIITHSESLSLHKNQNISNLKHLVNDDTFNKIQEFYDNVLNNDNSLLTDIIKNHLKTLKPSAIKFDRESIKNKDSCAHQVFGEKYLIFYEKDTLESLSLISSSPTQNKRDKNKI
jgi:hypothetical protein